MLNHLTSLVFSILESFLIFQISSYLLTFRFAPKYRYTPFLGISVVFSVWQYISPNFDSSLLIASKMTTFVLIFIIVYICYDGTFGRKLLSLLLYLLFTIAAEGILLLLAILPPLDLSLSDIQDVPHINMLFNLFTRLVIFFFITFLKTHYNKKYAVSTYQNHLLILLLLNAAVCYVILYFFTTEAIYSNIDFVILLVSTLSILVISLFCTYIIMTIVKRSQKDLEYQLALRQMTMENKMNEDMGSVVNKLRSMRHDMNNHFNVITGLINQEEYTLLKEYVSNLKEDVSDADRFILLGNKALTILLNNKLAKAGMHDIKFNTEITTDSLPFTDLDLCTLLGNMIDNAIEACLQVEDSRYINLSITQKGSLIKILCENPYRQEPTVLNNRFLTSKQDSNIHGIGIQSMRTVAKKYNAELDFNFGDGVFVTQIMM